MDFPILYEDAKNCMSWRKQQIYVPYRANFHTEYSTSHAKICENKLELLNMYTPGERPPLFGDRDFMHVSYLDNHNK